MKTKQFAGIGLAALAACLAAGVVTAQERTPPDAEAIQQSLRDKAKRIPRRELASALRSARDERSERARTVPRKPDLEALREDLRRTAEEDRTRRSADFSVAARAPSSAPGIRPASAQTLRRTAPAELSRAAIPVLLPSAPALRDRLKIYGMENVYTATARIDQSAGLSITGTCNRVVGGAPQTVAMRRRMTAQPRRLEGTNADYFISRNDFGVDLSFSKFGCGYVMTVECGEPASDARCSGDDFITALASSMILANPELAGGE